MGSVRRGPLVLTSWLAASSLLCAGSAYAQVGASLSADTDFRYRGVSLTDGRPVARVTASYDHSSGGYGGASLIFGEATDGSLGAIGYSLYGGYARRMRNDLTLDLGLTRTEIKSLARVSIDVPGPPGVVYSYRFSRAYVADYTQAYTGLIGGI